MIIENDAQSRNVIIQDIDKNLFVEAGAGSGKTTMLVNRMVAMVEAGIDVSKISAITFTKNAALEFYKRFQSLLIDRSNPNFEYKPKGFAGELPAPTDKSRELCAKALQNIDLCFMGTIDSFCNMILSEHPSEAGIPSDAALISAEEEKSIYSKFLVSARLGEYGPELKKMADCFAMLHNDPQDVFAVCMKEIMDRRNVRFIYDEEKVFDPSRKFKQEESDLKKVFRVFVTKFDDMTIPYDPDKDETREGVFEDARRAVNRGIKAAFNSYYWTLRRISGFELAGNKKANGFDKECVIREIAGNIRLNVYDPEEPKNHQSLANRMQAYKYNVTMTLCQKAVEILANLMKSQGKFTFFDYIYYLRNVLNSDVKNGAKLINYIYNRHSYFMIDEFQDTNPIQSEIFFYLSSENPVEDWSKCKPRNGSLFIVGDPKQSIYRFRSADVSSYLRIKEIFDSGVGDVLYLSNNFRSNNLLKGFFNDVFEETIKEDEDHNQSNYKDIENVDRSDAGEPGVLTGMYTYESYGKKLAANVDSEKEDSKIIAGIIKGLVGNPAYAIKDSKGHRNAIKYSDFMVIAVKKKMGAMIEEFKKNGIPAKVEGKVLFESCEALIAITSIMKAICHPDDSIALVAALKSKVFGFNNADILDYRNKKGVLKLRESDELPENSEVSKAIAGLCRVANGNCALTPSSLFTAIMDEYELFSSVTTEGMEVVYYSLELLKNAETGKTVVTNDDAIEFLEELISGDSELERCLSLKEEDDVVQIANVHKVKGLEKPIVILAQHHTSSFPNKPTIRVEHGEGESKGWIIKVEEKGKNTPHVERLYDDVKTIEDKEKIAGKAEIARLVYVAATRAREVLITNYSFDGITSKGNLKKAANAWKNIVEKSNNGNIMDLIGDYTCNIEEKKKVKAEDLYCKEPFANANPQPSYVKQTPSTLKSSSIYEGDSAEKEGVKEEAATSGDESYSTLIGTMVHRLMEMMVTSLDGFGKDVVIDKIIDDYLLSDFAKYESSFRYKLGKVYDVMHSGGFIQKNGCQQDILPILLQADGVYCEVPFNFREDDNIWNGIIDLLYEKDGKFHIIDWKTNRSDEGLAEHYKDQLTTYRKATKTMTGIDVEDALIYHIDIQ